MSLIVPMYEATNRMPGQKTTAAVSNVKDTRFDSVKGLADTATQLFANRSERQANAEILEAKNQIREWSREEYHRVQAERRGKAAMADEDKGIKSVYDNYHENVSEKISKRLEGIPSRFQDAAREQLEGVAEPYRNGFATYQSNQEAEWRKQEKYREVANITAETYLKISQGVGLQAVKDGVKEIDDAVKAHSGGAENAEFVHEKSRDMLKNSIMAQADMAGKVGENMLKDKFVKDRLTPSEIETLREYAQEKQTEQDAEWGIDMIKQANVPYPDQKELADKLKLSEEAKEKVDEWLDYNEGQRKKQKVAGSSMAIDELFTQYFDNGVDVDPVAYKASDKYKNMTTAHKQVVNKWFKDKASVEMSPMDRQRARYAAEQEIIAGNWDETDIMANMGTKLDIRDANSLVNFARSKKTNPRQYSYMDIVFATEYPTEYQNKTINGRVMRAVMQDVDDYQARHKIYPTQKDMQAMMRDAVEGAVKSVWYWNDDEVVDKLQDIIPGISTPGYKFIGEEEKRPSYALRVDANLMREGYSSPMWSEKMNVHILGEKEGDGKMWYKFNGKTKYFPMGSPEAIELQDEIDRLQRKK